MAIAAAQRTYKGSESNAYHTVSTTRAGLDRAYWIQEASAAAVQFGLLASTTGTPWAVFDSAEATAKSAWVATVAVQQETSSSTTRFLL